MKETTLGRPVAGDPRRLSGEPAPSHTLESATATGAAAALAGTTAGRDAALARTLLTHAILLGIAGDALLRGRPGVGAFMWIVNVALAMVSLVWTTGRLVPPQARAWLMAAITFAAFVAWRDAEELRALNVIAVAASLGLAAMSVRSPRGAALSHRVREVVWPAASAARHILLGLIPSAAAVARAPRTHSPGLTLSAIARAVAIAGAMLVVFGSLLQNADPVFASLIALLGFDLDTAVSHVVVIAALTWIVAGWSSSALTREKPATAPDELPFTLGLADMSAALGSLIVLFTAFVAAQVGLLFGGEEFLRERTGLTAAEYARGGFFQLVFVVFLVVPVLMATRAALKPGPELARRHTTLALPVIALLGAIACSAVLRLRLYVSLYGLTTDRLYALAFVAWLSVLLLWFAATVLRDQGRAFVAGAALSAAGALCAMNVLSPDAFVARYNVVRAPGPAQVGPAMLDVTYLARLSGDAAPHIVRGLLLPSPQRDGTRYRLAADAERCLALGILLERWGPDAAIRSQIRQPGAWRFRNAGQSRALREVAANAGALHAARSEVCAAATPPAGG
jgi:hypothetical protein